MSRLSVGDPVPAFEMSADDGRVVSNESLAGTRYVLYFYPKDDTPGCTTQACGIRDSWARVTGTGITLFGVSPDSVQSHVKFREKYALRTGCSPTRVTSWPRRSGCGWRRRRGAGPTTAMSAAPS